MEIKSFYILDEDDAKIFPILKRYKHFPLMIQARF